MSPDEPPVLALSASAAPSGWVQRWTHLVAAGRPVLDLASGAGRHAHWFAARGHPVVALDRDATALESARGERIETRVVDLEQAAWPLPPEAKFAAVVVTHYLHRPLFPSILHALAPGGVLIYETFAQGNETVGKPSRPAFLLAPGELLEVVRGDLRVIAFEDGFTAAPRPAYVQRICAVRPQLQPDAAAMPAATVPRYDLAG
ncbi:class I SAM-dependent methyltransferase [Paraburkholderia bonniea]|nr:class I SAM-dependent methyltransferase [Paraburkholderia bonniea]WJF91390.1 class I SAM-dependent methyltransferase [Paraburkholderia bonniea]WJF94706.1 class I SAM-dependent methyltransferase [Paraburkholderia bonniea]